MFERQVKWKLDLKWKDLCAAAGQNMPGSRQRKQAKIALVFVDRMTLV
jgi:hypothetical protein